MRLPLLLLLLLVLQILQLTLMLPFVVNCTLAAASLDTRGPLPYFVVPDVRVPRTVCRRL